MNPTCNKYTLDIVALKRPTALDKLAESIPKPQGAIPNFGLPKWKVMPLESKIPMVPGPAGAYNFTRRKVGRRLWIPAPDAEFNLSDPYCYEMKMSYDALHDMHLIPYFSRSNNLRHLIKAGLITKNLDAKCSLRDYNMYRKYLRKLHCDSMKKELKKRTKWSIEDRAIQYAQEQAEREVKKLKERERLTELRRAIITSRKMAEKLKLQQQKEKQQKAEERLRSLIQKRIEDRRLQHIKSEARAEFIKQKLTAAADIRRKKIIQTFLEWNKKERIRKKTRQMRLAREREQKHQILEKKWEEKQQLQKQQIKHEQFLLKCVEDQRNKFIEAYNAKIKKETERMKKLLIDVKMYIKCYLARRRARDKERICCKKYFEVDDADERSTMKQKMDEADKYYRKASSSRMSEARERSRIGKQGKIGGKMGVGGKGYKTSGAKGRRRRRKKKKKLREEIDESEGKPETEGEQSGSTSKAETSETSSSSQVKDKCRCHIIKDAIKTLKT